MQISGVTDAEFHRVRSELVDAFAAIELEICRLLRMNAIEAERRPLGQRIDVLKEVKASPRYSKASRKVVLDTLATLPPLLEVRGDIVHSILVIVAFGKNDRRAAFINPQRSTAFGTEARLLTLACFEDLSKACREAVRALAEVS